MAYNVLIYPKASKFLDKINKNDRERLKKKIKSLKDNPEKRGKHLRHVDYRSLRTGVYRAIYYINKEKKRVGVVFIGHRKDVYDDFSKLF